MSKLPLHYSRTFAIAPSDAVDFTVPCYGIYVGGTGDVSLVDLAGNTRVFKAVPVGLLPVASKRVNQTGTTATELIGLQ